MTSPRGRVLIINNDDFDDVSNPDQANLDYRDGSEVDLSSLEQIFKALNFIVITRSDVSSQEILDSISNETKHRNHDKYGMFVLVILSHGHEGVIYGSDSRKVSINDITRRLTAKSFPAMADKPKLIIIQACAGGEMDNTCYAIHTDTSGIAASALPVRSRVVKPTVSDFVMMQASCPGFVSFRESHSGSFMIQAVVDVLRDYSCHESITELVVRVRNRVLKKCEKAADQANIGAQTIHLSETLRKKLYFFPGISALESLESTRMPAWPPPTEDPRIYLSAVAMASHTNTRSGPRSVQAAACSANQAPYSPLPQTTRFPSPPSTVSALSNFVDSTIAQTASSGNQPTDLRSARASLSYFSLPPPLPPRRTASPTSNISRALPLPQAAAYLSNQTTPLPSPQTPSFPSPPSTVSAITSLFELTVTQTACSSNQPTDLRSAGASLSYFSLPPPLPPRRTATPTSNISRAPPSPQVVSTTSKVHQTPPSPRAAAFPCPPPIVSVPPAVYSSTSSVKFSPLVKLRHLETIPTLGACYTVTLDPDNQVLHAGRRYDSLNGTRDGLMIDCIRAATDNQLIMLEKNCKTETAHIVTYQLDKKPTLLRKLVTKVTSKTAYTPVNKIQVHYNDINHFTKIDNLLIQTGAGSGTIYFYEYSTGDLIREVTHPDMEWACGICHDTNSNIFLTDYDSKSIFNFTMNNDGIPTVNKLNCEIDGPISITSHDGLLVVLSNVKPVPKLHIITTRGERVTSMELPECRDISVYDLSINARGVVAIANWSNGLQLYKFE